LILVDASGVLAALDDREPRHAETRDALLASHPPRLLSPFVLAELDYLVLTRSGRRSRSALLEEVTLGAYRLTRFATDDVAEARGLIDRFADLDLSLADASIVVLAHRHRVTDVLTLDERHFRVLPGPGGPFRLLPADG
jgi:uncharacterized protein